MASDSEIRFRIEQEGNDTANMHGSHRSTREKAVGAPWLCDEYIDSGRHNAGGRTMIGVFASIRCCYRNYVFIGRRPRLQNQKAAKEPCGA